MTGYTDADVQLVAQALAVGCCDGRSSICRGHWSDAAAALKALAEAGRLTPDGAEREEHWGVVGTTGWQQSRDFGKPYVVVFASREDAEESLAQESQYMRERDQMHVARRDVLTGTWVEADGTP